MDFSPGAYSLTLLPHTLVSFSVLLFSCGTEVECTGNGLGNGGELPLSFHKIRHNSPRCRHASQTLLERKGGHSIDQLRHKEDVIAPPITERTDKPYNAVRQKSGNVVVSKNVKCYRKRHVKPKAGRLPSSAFLYDASLLKHKKVDSQKNHQTSFDTSNKDKSINSAIYKESDARTHRPFAVPNILTFHLTKTPSYSTDNDYRPITSPGRINAAIIIQDNGSSTRTRSEVKKSRSMGHFLVPHFGMIDRRSGRRPDMNSSHSVEGTFLWAVGLFGTVENSAIVLTLLFSKRFRRPLHLLVGSLAITDLFISLVYIPSYTYFLLEGSIQESNAGVSSQMTTVSYCTLSRAVFVEAASVALTIKTLIAVYLYIFTISKDLVKRAFSHCKTRFYLVISCLGNFFVHFTPAFVGYTKVDFYPNVYSCWGTEIADNSIVSELINLKIAYNFSTLGFHLFQLLIIALCFLQIYRAILRGRVFCEQHRKKDRETKQNYKRVLKLTALVFVSICVCWLPIYIVNIVDPHQERLPEGVHHLAMDLLFIKSAINPAIYIYGVRTLRYEMRFVCTCRCGSPERFVVDPGQHYSSSFCGPSRTVATSYAGV